MLCTRRQTYSGHKIDANKKGGTCREYGGQQKCIQGFGGENYGKRPFERPTRIWENTEINIHKVGSGTWNGLIWLRTGICGVLLLTRESSTGFHEKRRIF